MTCDRFEHFPPDARLWIYGLDRALDDETSVRAAERLERFVAGWQSHQIPVTGAFAIVENRFVMLAGYCDDGISGCSTDSSVQAVRSLGELGVNGLDNSLVFFRDESGAVTSLSRGDFQQAVNEGRVAPGTTVFDPTLQKVEELRSGRFEVMFENCWHARAFKRVTV